MREAAVVTGNGESETFAGGYEEDDTERAAIRSDEENNNRKATRSSLEWSFGAGEPSP